MAILILLASNAGFFFWLLWMWDDRDKWKTRFQRREDDDRYFAALEAAKRTKVVPAKAMQRVAAEAQFESQN